MDFDNVEVFPQYNLPGPPVSCPGQYDEDEPPDICTEHCQVFVCSYIERDEVHAPGL